MTQYNYLLSIDDYEEFKAYLMGLFEGKGENEKFNIFNDVCLVLGGHKWLCEKYELLEVLNNNTNNMTSEEKNEFLEGLNAFLDTDYKTLEETIKPLQDRGGFYEIAFIFLNHFDKMDEVLGDDILERLYECLNDFQFYEKAKKEIKEKFLKEEKKTSVWKQRQIQKLVLITYDYFKNSKDYNYIIDFANKILEEI